MWYVGLDWSDTHHDVVVLDDAGKRVGARRFPHSPEGLNDLKQFVLSRATSPENLACIVETSYGLLISFLLSAGFPVYPVNPKMAQKLRKVAGAKTDQIDAYVLAKLGRFDLDELRRLEPDSPTLLFLQAYPTLQAARAVSLEEIKATLRAGKHTSPTKVALRTCARAASSTVGSSRGHRPRQISLDAGTGRTIVGGD